MKIAVSYSLIKSDDSLDLLSKLKKRTTKFYIINDTSIDSNEEIMKSRCEHIGIKYAGLVETTDFNAVDYIAYDRVGLNSILKDFEKVSIESKHSKDEALLYFILAIIPFTSFFGVHAFMYKRKVLGFIHLGILAFMILIYAFGSISGIHSEWEFMIFAIPFIQAAILSYALSVISGVIELLSASKRKENATENQTSEKNSTFRMVSGIIVSIIAVGLYIHWFCNLKFNGTFFGPDINFSLIAIIILSTLGSYLSSHKKNNPLRYLNLILLLLTIIIIATSFIKIILS